MPRINDQAGLGQHRVVGIPKHLLFVAITDFHCPNALDPAWATLPEFPPMYLSSTAQLFPIAPSVMIGSAHACQAPLPDQCGAADRPWREVLTIDSEYHAQGAKR